MAKKTQKKAKPAAKKTVKAAKSAIKVKKITKAATKTKKAAKPAAAKVKKVAKAAKPSAKAKKAAKPTKTKTAAKTSAKPVGLTSKAAKVDFANWVTPLDDRILVQIAEEERVTPGGLYIPDTVADVSGNFKGHVVAVGRGHLDKKGKIRPLDVKNGDTVVFSQFSGSKIEYQGETVIFLREADVLGIVNK